MLRKNTAGQFIHFQGVDAATGGIKSGVTWTVRRCLDGTFAAATGTVTEDGTTGWYKFAMSQADTNGNNIGFNFTGTDAVPQTVNAITTACDPTSTAFGLSLAKTTNITGFNDIAATAIVSSGAITTLAGAVVSVTTAATVTTVTGLTAANLDVAVSTRLATAGYTAPDNTSIAAILVDTGTTLDAAIAAVKVDTAATLIDTAEIGAAGAGLTALATAVNLATVDTVVDAIKAKTDSLTFTVAGFTDVNLLKVNGVTIVGDGAGTPFNV